MECGIWNVELVGFADYSIMNYSMKNSMTNEVRFAIDCEAGCSRREIKQ